MRRIRLSCPAFPAPTEELGANHGDGNLSGRDFEPISLAVHFSDGMIFCRRFLSQFSVSK
jgi:hypothetical protein